MMFGQMTKVCWDKSYRPLQANALSLAKNGTNSITMWSHWLQMKQLLFVVVNKQFPSQYDSRVVIYECKLFTRLAPERENEHWKEKPYKTKKLIKQSYSLTMNNDLATAVICTLEGFEPELSVWGRKTMPLRGRGPVVSAHVFFSDDSSSDHAKVNLHFSTKRWQLTKKRPSLDIFNNVDCSLIFRSFNRQK